MIDEEKGWKKPGLSSCGFASTLNTLCALANSRTRKHQRGLHSQTLCETQAHPFKHRPHNIIFLGTEQTARVRDYLYSDGWQDGVAVSNGVPGEEPSSARVHYRPISAVVDGVGVLAGPSDGDVAVQRDRDTSRDALQHDKCRKVDMLTKGILNLLKSARTHCSCFSLT